MSKELFTVWDTLYKSKVGSKYPFNGGRDGAWMKEWRGIYSDADMTRFMEAFFIMDDPFFAERGWSLGCFRGCLPKVIAYVNRKGSVAIKANMQAAPWWRPENSRAVEKWRESCQHEPACISQDVCWLKSTCPHEPQCEDLRPCRERMHMEKRRA